MKDINNSMWKMEFGNQNRKRWVIEKQVRRICFGNPGYIDEWIDYSSHDTEEEAQKELRMLENFSDPLAYESYKIVDRANDGR